MSKFQKPFAVCFRRKKNRIIFIMNVQFKPWWSRVQFILTNQMYFTGKFRQVHYNEFDQWIFWQIIKYWRYVAHGQQNEKKKIEQHERNLHDSISLSCSFSLIVCVFTFASNMPTWLTVRVKCLHSAYQNCVKPLIDQSQQLFTCTERLSVAAHSFFNSSKYAIINGSRHEMSSGQDLAKWQCSSSMYLFDKKNR